MWYLVTTATRIHGEQRWDFQTSVTRLHPAAYLIEVIEAFPSSQTALMSWMPLYNDQLPLSLAMDLMTSLESNGGELMHVDDEEMIAPARNFSSTFHPHQEKEDH